jgi:hypothetical protein
MSLKFNNVNYSCRISNRSNNSTTLSCAPQKYIENFQVVSNDKLTAAGWYQVAGTVSGSGGAGGVSNVFTTDSNWAYNNERIPTKYASLKDTLQIIAITNGGANIVGNIVPGPAGNVVLTLGRNTNVSGSQTFWFKNILADSMGGNKNKEFQNVGLTF